jgi:hypothetical protein
MYDTLVIKSFAGEERASRNIRWEHHFGATERLETSQPEQPRHFGRGVHAPIPTLPCCDDISVLRDHGRKVDAVFDV